MPLYRSHAPARLGSWVTTPGTFVLANTAVSEATHYALNQSTAGVVTLNSSSLGIFCRADNQFMGTISTSGLSFGTANFAGSMLDVVGSAGVGSVFVTTASLTIGVTHHTVLSNSTVAAISVTLPAAGGSGARREYIVKKIDATTLALNLLAPSTSSLIDGTTAQQVTAQNAGWHVKSSSAQLSSTNGWWIVGRCSTL